MKKKLLSIPTLALCLCLTGGVLAGCSQPAPAPAPTTAPTPTVPQNEAPALAGTFWQCEETGELLIFRQDGTMKLCNAAGGEAETGTFVPDGPSFRLEMDSDAEWAMEFRRDAEDQTATLRWGEGEYLYRRLDQLPDSYSEINSDPFAQCIEPDDPHYGTANATLLLEGTHWILTEVDFYFLTNAKLVSAGGNGGFLVGSYTWDGSTGTITVGDQCDELHWEDGVLLLEDREAVYSLYPWTDEHGSPEYIEPTGGLERLILGTWVQEPDSGTVLEFFPDRTVAISTEQGGYTGTYDFTGCELYTELTPSSGRDTEHWYAQATEDGGLLLEGDEIPFRRLELSLQADD